MAGSYAQLRQTVLHRGGDVIVSQAGVSNFLTARSVARAKGEAVQGVKPAIWIAVSLSTLIEAYAPVYLVLTTEPAALWRIALVAIVLAVLGALAPLQTLRRLSWPNRPASLSLTQPQTASDI